MNYGEPLKTCSLFLAVKSVRNQGSNQKSLVHWISSKAHLVTHRVLTVPNQRTKKTPKQDPECNSHLFTGDSQLLDLRGIKKHIIATSH